jgi:hypothetical protein
MTISMPVGLVTEEHDWDAESGAVGELPEWRLVVAPARGIFHAPGTTGDGYTEEGHTLDLGHIEARRDRQAIIAPWHGAIIEWLVQDGDPVALSQPVARLLPDGAEPRLHSAESGTA